MLVICLQKPGATGAEVKSAHTTKVKTIISSCAETLNFS